MLVGARGVGILPLYAAAIKVSVGMVISKEYPNGTDITTNRHSMADSVKIGFYNTIFGK